MDLTRIAKLPGNGAGYVARQQLESSAMPKAAGGADKAGPCAGIGEGAKRAQAARMRALAALDRAGSLLPERPQLVVKLQPVRIDSAGDVAELWADTVAP